MGDKAAELVSRSGVRNGHDRRLARLARKALGAARIFWLRFAVAKGLILGVRRRDVDAERRRQVLARQKSVSEPSIFGEPFEQPPLRLGRQGDERLSASAIAAGRAPTSASAKLARGPKRARRAIAVCTAASPVRAASASAASSSAGESATTARATSQQSAVSASRMWRGGWAALASASASERRTSAEASSSAVVMARIASARSASDIDECR